MSDGPHKTLPMRSAWRTVAKRADQSVYDSSQVTDVMRHALARDWHLEVPAALQSALARLFREGDNPLGLPGLSIAGSDELRALSTGSPLAMSFVTHATESYSAGHGTVDDLFRAAGRALVERGEACARQVEEHYKRARSPFRHPQNIRDRLHFALHNLDATTLGKIVLSSDAMPPRPRRATGIDDGVPL